MSLRIFSAGVIATSLAACSEEPSPAARGDAIECAIGEGVEISEVCRLERAANGETASFILHHPDGGFRRISFDSEAQELGVADGADTLQISDESSDTLIQFAIGQDIYRVPATMLRAPAK